MCDYNILTFFLVVLDKNATFLFIIITFLYSFNQRNWLHGFETESYDSWQKKRLFYMISEI